jgi:hypothetical protein
MINKTMINCGIPVIQMKEKSMSVYEKAWLKERASHFFEKSKSNKNELIIKLEI